MGERGVLLTKQLGRLSAVFTMMGILLGGCASLGPAIPPVREAVMPQRGVSGTGWWKVSFQMRWPEDTEPCWYMDLFIAHEIVSPVLDQYEKDIILWRFHRRAARDQGGHQFSFIFYCAGEIAQEIHSSIESSRHLEKMKTAGEIVQDIYDDTGSIAKPQIEDMSDSRWSPPIKRSWPYYIMGVSQMWLHLIEQIAEQTSNGEGPSSVREMEAFYTRVDEVITETWQEEGRHALLHHLNAIFGYRPIAVYEKRFLTF
jgi:hypothetical protein